MNGNGTAALSATFLLAVQAFVTTVLLGYSLFLFVQVGGEAARTLGTVIVSAVTTHWFKESSAIGRRAAMQQPQEDAKHD